MVKKQVFKISGMHCASCPMNIDWDLEDTSGVKSAKTSYAKQACEVEFDEDKVQIDGIIKTIQKSGYKAQVLKSF